MKRSQEDVCFIKKNKRYKWLKKQMDFYSLGKRCRVENNASNNDKALTVFR